MSTLIATDGGSQRNASDSATERNRTADLTITNRLLYQLSYGGGRRRQDNNRHSAGAIDSCGRAQRAIPIRLHNRRPSLILGAGVQHAWSREVDIPKNEMEVRQLDGVAP